MYVYKHTFIHNYSYNGGVGYEFQCKSRCAQIQSNTAQVNTILHVHNQFLYDYFNIKTKKQMSVTFKFVKRQKHIRLNNCSTNSGNFNSPTSLRKTGTFHHFVSKHTNFMDMLFPYKTINC